MKTILIGLVGLVSFFVIAITSFAGINETLAECEKVYGKGEDISKTFKGGPTGVKRFYFEHDKLRIFVGFEKDGKALRRKFDFPAIGNDINVYPYPHPEQVTIPKYIPLKQVTNRGTVLPDEYYTLTKNVCKAGLASREPVNVNGQMITPYDFAMAYIIRERERILKETNFGQQRGCCTVVAKGKKNGQYEEYRFHMASQSEALGEGTGIPAAMGAILMQQGKITKKGVLPPEGCVNPVDFIDLISKVMGLDKKNKDSHKEFGGILVQKIDANGNIEIIDI